MTVTVPPSTRPTPATESVETRTVVVTMPVPMRKKAIRDLLRRRLVLPSRGVHHGPRCSYSASSVTSAISGSMMSMIWRHTKTRMALRAASTECVFLRTTCTTMHANTSTNAASSQAAVRRLQSMTIRTMRKSRTMFITPMLGGRKVTWKALGVWQRRSKCEYNTLVTLTVPRHLAQRLQGRITIFSHSLCLFWLTGILVHFGQKNQAVDEMRSVFSINLECQHDRPR